MRYHFIKFEVVYIQNHRGSTLHLRKMNPKLMPALLFKVWTKVLLAPILRGTWQRSMVEPRLAQNKMRKSDAFDGDFSAKRNE